MQKAEPQKGLAPNQPAMRQGGGVALVAPQGEKITQLETMIESSPQVEKQGALAALINTGSTMTAQRKLLDRITNSPSMAAQRKFGEGIHHSPRMVAQRKKNDSLFGTAQRVEDEEPLQGKFTPEAPARQAAPKPNNTGLPDHLKSGIEHLSGMSMDNVKVHYNSSQPAQLNALAYAQGTDIHIAPGQEQHLPHEAWHVVQQAQGRVQPTRQMKDGVPVNDDKGLEREADVMGGKAMASGDDVDAVGKGEQSDKTQLNLLTLERGLIATDNKSSISPLQKRNNLKTIQNGFSNLPIQAIWVTENYKIYKWDTEINGRKWQYDAETGKYSFEICDLPELLKAVKLDEVNWRDILGIGKEDEITENIVQDKLKNVKPFAHFGAYFTKEDESNLTRFLVPNIPIADQFTIECLNYFNPQIRSPEFVKTILNSKGISAKFIEKVVGSLPQLLQSKNISSGIANQNLFKIQDDYCFIENDGYSEKKENSGKMKELVNQTLAPVLNEVVWFHILPEIEKATGFSGDEALLESKEILSNTQKTINNFQINFTQRVNPNKYEVGTSAVQCFYDKLLELSNPELFSQMIRKEMQSDFFRTLETKDTSIGNKDKKNNEEISEKIFGDIKNKETEIEKYVEAVCKRWSLFLSKKLIVVFDSAGLNSVFGKTPGIAGATPKNMMEDKGLLDAALAVVNLDSHDSPQAVFITLAHECAHMVGFNPTGHEASGHFTDSDEYEKAEAQYGPKLLFDAYYFETLVGKK